MIILQSDAKEDYTGIRISVKYNAVWKFNLNLQGTLIYFNSTLRYSMVHSGLLESSDDDCR